MQRVAIIGSPGAGKTVFGRALAHKTGLPLIHLDKIYHDNHFSYTTDREAWRNRVRQLTQEPMWIIDGNYRSTFDIRLPAADTIIFLDYPTRLTMWRATKRRFQYRKSVRSDMPKNWRERLDRHFLWYILTYRHKYRTEVLALLQQYSDKHIYICKSPKHVSRLLQIP